MFVYCPTMRSAVLAFALLAAVSAGAATPPPSPLPVFPDDYTVSTCAPTSCDTFHTDEFANAAFRFLGLSTDLHWFEAHSDELLALMEPFCKKRNTCIATPGNAHMFCDDLVTPGMRTACDTKYPREKDPHGWDQCSAWVEVYALGMTQQSLPVWRTAQACAKPGAFMHDELPEVWMAPEKIPTNYEGYLTIFAIDRNTHVPVYGHIGWENQIIYAPSNPTGETATYYPFKGPVKLVRVPNADGHFDVVPPKVTITWEYYPTMTYRLPMIIPTMTAQLETDKNFKRPGKHTIKVVAKDANGSAADVQVMLGDRAIGPANTPIEVERDKNEKFPDIWVTSLFDRYSDVVVAKAEK